MRLGVDNLIAIRLSPSTGGQMRSSNQNWPAVRAINLEDLRGDSPDHADDSNLGDGADEGGFDLNDYEGADPAIIHHCFPAPATH